MKFLNRNCRDVTRLVRQHLRVCAACPRFSRQVALMREAMGRWRRYSEAER
jgi:hypothetical protein